MTTPVLDRDLAPLFLRVVEAGALAAARWMGQGDNTAADRAAVEAIRAALSELPLRGTVFAVMSCGFGRRTWAGCW